ncbi:LADA_0C03026g1_1 [Lachancea dasiensis]|uniref:LADA_0C03026g1_1 n=1 Tax=Lachancea dasiensis TaxID=1072105 RepID=A0A1G4IYA5_9SACH|nr:LADA_0C03026g1_1 [Lachancea dasiensis]
MSSFWDQNKGSIKSGLATAGKYGYQGTKFVAKTGYHAGKQHYNNTRGIKTDDTGSSSASFRDAAPVTSLPDVSNLPPPPLKPGQSSYHGPARQSGMSDTSTRHVPVPPAQGPTPEIQYTGTPVPSQAPQVSQSVFPVSEELPKYTPLSIPPSAVPAPTVPRPLASLPPTAENNIDSPGMLRLDTSSTATQGTIINQRAVPAVPGMPSSGFQTLGISDNAITLDTTKPDDAATHELAPAIPQRTYMRAPAPIPIQPVASETPLETPATYDNDNTSGSDIGVKPYVWKSPEDKEKSKVKIPKVELASLSEPPRHRDRTPSASGASSPQNVLASPASTGLRSCGSPVMPGQWQTSLEQDHVLDDKMVDETNLEQLEKGVSGRYTNTGAVNFPPPPRASRTDSNQHSKSAANMAIAANGSGIANAPRKPPSLPQRSSQSASITALPPRPKSQTPALATRNSEKDAQPIQSAVVGSYNSSPQVNFVPPPKPFRRDMPSSKSVPAKPVAPVIPQRTTGTYDTHHDDKSPPPYRDVEPLESQPSIISPRANSPISIAKEKKLPPPKKAIPQTLQNLARNNESNQDTPSKKVPPPKPSRRGVAAPPKPARKPQLPGTPGINGGSEETDKLDTELQARLKLRRSTAERTPSARQNNDELSASMHADRIRPTIPPVKPKSPPMAANDNNEVEDQDQNPFQRYLRNAVPLENDRLHKFG